MAVVQGRRRTAARQADTRVRGWSELAKGVEEEELGVEIMGCIGRAAGCEVDCQDQ